MPNPRLGVTYIFSNGYLSILGNIIFDIKQTSYSYVDSNIVTFSITNRNDWTIQEFHYQDVVEITYTPRDSALKIINELEKKYPVDGVLMLSLTSGAKNFYPTTKENINNFLNYARDKVRKAKLRI